MEIDTVKLHYQSRAGAAQPRAANKSQNRITQSQPKSPARVLAGKRAAERRKFVKVLDVAPRYWDEWSDPRPCYPVAMSRDFLSSDPRVTLIGGYGDGH
jgi:hypothetical protein